MANLKSGILITGDSKGAVKAIRLTKEEVGQLNASTKKAAISTNDYGDKLRATAKKVGAFGAAAATAAAAGLAAMISSQRDIIDKLAKTSDKLGIATEALGGLRHAAALTGVDSGKLDVALQRMTRRLSEAAKGSGEAVGALNELGLSAQDLKDLSPDQQFKRIADAMGDVKNQSDRVRLAFKFFDSEGVGLVNTLKLGSKGLDDITKRTEIFGTSLSRVDAAKIEQMNDSIFESSQFFDGFAKQITVQFAPLINELAQEFFNVGAEAGGMGKVAEKVFRFVTKAAGVFGDAIRGLQVVFKGVALAAAKFTELFTQKVADIDALVTALLNKLPGFLGGGGFEQNSIIQNINESVKNTAQNLRNEMEDLLNEPLPSEKIEEFIVKIEKKSREAAENVTEAHEDMSLKVTGSYDSILESAEATQRGAAIIAEDAANETETVWKDAGDSITNIFSDVFKGTIKSFEDLTESVKRSFQDLLGDMAQQALKKQISFNFGGTHSAGGAAGGFLQSAGPLAAGSLVLSSIGTLFDDNASAARKRNNFGLLTGGLGFALPSKLFGGPSNKTQSGKVNLQDFGFSVESVDGKDKFSQEGNDAARAGAVLVAAFAQAVTEKTNQVITSSGFDLEIGQRDGIKVHINDSVVFEIDTKAENALQKAIDFSINFLADEVGANIDIYRSLAAENETVVEAMIRLDSQFELVSNISNTLGLNLDLVGDAGIKAADELVRAAGGMEALATQSQFFYDRFFTEQEKFAFVFDGLKESFGDLNIALPNSRSQFKELVQSLGAESQAALLKLAPKFDIYITQIEGWETQLTGLYQDLLEREPDAAGLQFYLDALRNGETTIEDVAKSISASVEALNQITDTSTQPNAAADMINGLMDALTPGDVFVGNANDAVDEFEAVGETFVDIVKDVVDNSGDLVKALANVDREFLPRISEIEKTINKIRGNELTAVQQIELRYKTEADLIEQSRKAAIDSYNEQLQAVEAFNNAAVTLTQTADELFVGDLSTLTKTQQLERARADFASTAERARNGDASAIGELSNLSSQTLQLGRDVFASSPEFTKLFDSIQTTLREIGGIRQDAPAMIDVSQFDRRQEALRERQIELLQDLLLETKQAKEEARNNVKTSFSDAVA